MLHESDECVSMREWHKHKNGYKHIHNTYMRLTERKGERGVQQPELNWIIGNHRIDRFGLQTSSLPQTHLTSFIIEEIRIYVYMHEKRAEHNEFVKSQTSHPISLDLLLCETIKGGVAQHTDIQICVAQPVRSILNILHCAYGKEW